MSRFRRRSLEPENVDQERPPRELVESTHRALRRINLWLGGLRASRIAFRQFRRGWRAGERIRVLDVGSGAGDIPRALARWDPRIEVTCLDRVPDPGGVVDVIGNGLRLPFRDGAFDYVITSLFLHHLTDEGALAALREFDRVARRGMVMNDLIRRRRLYFWTKIFTRFCHEVVRSDGLLSVLKSFTVKELRALAAPLPYLKVRACLSHRLIVYGEKGAAP